METKIANNDGNLKQYLPFKTKTSVYDVTHLLGHEPFDEYVSDTVIQNMRMQIGGGGSVSVDGIEIEKLLGEGLFDI